MTDFPTHLYASTREIPTPFGLSPPTLCTLYVPIIANGTFCSRDNMSITCVLTAALCCANVIEIVIPIMLVFERKYKHAVKQKLPQTMTLSHSPV